VDPLAGSWFVETTTNEMERLIETTLGRIAAEGGVVQGVDEGRVQAAVSRKAYERLRRVEAGELRKVGVNCYADDDQGARPVALHPYREAEAARQVERLSGVRRSRDGKRVSATLATLRAAAQAGQNVMPAIMDAVEAYATVGEMCGQLRDVLGTYQEPVRF